MTARWSADGGGDFCRQWASGSPAPARAGRGRCGTVGVAFETLDRVLGGGHRRHWAELGKSRLGMLEAIADGDANRQLEQVRGFVARGVDGIIVVPKDAKSIIPMIRAANEADPDRALQPAGRPSDARSVAVVADNLGIARATVEHLCTLARKTGKKQKAAILVGDRRRERHRPPGRVRPGGRGVRGRDGRRGPDPDRVEPGEGPRRGDERATRPPRPRPRLHLVRLHARRRSPRP